MFLRPLSVLFASTLLWGALSASAALSPLQPVRLRCESLDEPTGITVANPRLGWSFESRDPKARALTQTAYQVLVASDRKSLARQKGDLWDSGKTNSAACSQIRYEGDFLMPGQICFWKVRVWDQDGQPSPWSEPAVWTMGLLGRMDWQAKWIGWEPPHPNDATNTTFTGARWIWFPEGEPEKAAPIGKRFFRKFLELPASANLHSARLNFTGDNSCEVFVNGTRVGAVTDYHSAPEFDLKPLIKPGRNVLVASVDNVGTGPNPAGFIARLVLDPGNGVPLEIVTDQTWEAAQSAPADWPSALSASTEWRPALELGFAGMAPWGEIKGPEDRTLVARMLRRQFELDARVKRATLYASGLGLSEFYVNGRRLGDEVLSPGLTDYEKRVFYVTHDVTSLLKKGQNVVGAILGNGRYYAPRGEGTVSYGLPKLFLQLNIEHPDGSSTEIVSDEAWNVTTNGPVRANNEYDGEVYDARLELPGWAEPGFNDASWERVQLVKPPAGKLVAGMINPIRVTQTLKPVAITEPRPGVFVYDLGQNMVGWCRLKVSGPAGTEVRLRHAETLKPDGTLYLDNLRAAKVTDTYILKGRGAEVYEPRFTYHGFRFVEITGFPGKPTLSTLVGCVVHDDVESAGQFECSNPLLNRIYQNIRWGVRGNYRSVPTDCPQRDERQGWLGDRAAECKGETYLFDIDALYSKWLQDFADAQKETGSVPDVAPAYWALYSDNVTWPSATVIIPGVLRDQYGDTATLQRHYASAAQWVNYMTRFLTNGIISRDSYGDWCVPPEEQSLIHSKDPARKTDPALLATAYLYHDLTLLTNYATILGKMAEVRRYSALADEIKRAFNTRFFREAEGYYDNGTQTSCVLPLAFGLTPPEHRGRVFDHLVKKITVETDSHIGTGLIGGQWLMRVLTENGRADLAYTIANQRTYPSWGYMVDKGATTVWELWNGDTADPAMNSGNHVMLVGDLAIWMFEHLAGIKPDPQQPGFKHLLMTPQPVGDLQFVKASHQSPFGQIRSEWRRSGSTFQWNVTIPPNSTATLAIPASGADVVLESGRPAATARGITMINAEGGRAVLNVGSGSYRFESR